MKRLGILGGGQLAQMIAEAALKQNIKPVVLAESREQPAAFDGVEIIEGSLDDDLALYQMSNHCDVITIENEFLNLTALQSISTRKLRPGIETIATAQDKLKQRKLFDRLNIPAAQWCIAKEAERHFPEGYMLKWSRFGYDGHGNLVVSEKTTPETITDFCRRGKQRGAQIYAERFINFDCELAMVSTRSGNGTQVFFPLVYSRQEQNVCRETWGPVDNQELLEQAQNIMAVIASELNIVGTFAIEFFLVDGKLLVNEMAPRVHNSGHYSLFGSDSNQFEYHVKAVMGETLTPPQINGFAVMRNILGPWELSRLFSCPEPWQPPPVGTELKWYNKQEVRPGRKMGHLTGRASTPEEAQYLLQVMADYEERFWDTL